MSEKHEISLEVCSNTEWLRENGRLNLDLLADGSEDEAADRLCSEIMRRLIDAGYSADWAKGQRSTYHGWNGANTFARKLGPVGTFDALTPAQVEEIEQICEEAVKAAAAEFAA